MYVAHWICHAAHEGAQYDRAAQEGARYDRAAQEDQIANTKDLRV